jgi:methoxymalonate biosynthesis acyl carrier protein
MTTDQTSEKAPVTAKAIEDGLLRFLEERTKATVTPDQELFASGLVSSMFAMELVVFLERSYGVTIIGADLKLDNFRTVQAMTKLVLRIQDSADMARHA